MKDNHLTYSDPLTSNIVPPILYPGSSFRTPQSPVGKPRRSRSTTNTRSWRLVLGPDLEEVGSLQVPFPLPSPKNSGKSVTLDSFTDSLDTVSQRLRTKGSNILSGLPYPLIYCTMHSMDGSQSGSQVKSGRKLDERCHSPLTRKTFVSG